MTKFESWMLRKHHDFYTDDITYLLPVAQQVQTVYRDSCTSLHFTIFPESISSKCIYRFEVMGYIPTAKVKLILKRYPPRFIYSN